MNKLQKSLLLYALAWIVAATMRMEGFSFLCYTVVFVLIALAGYYQD